MATIVKQDKDYKVQLGSTPWGNLTALRYLLETNSTGAAINASSTAAIASGDKVLLGKLPAGFRLVDSQVLISTAMTAAVVGDLGFEYVDGVNDTGVPQDADYFGAALVLNAAGRLRNATTNATVTLPKDAWLTLTTGGAANAKASKVEVIVYGIAEGVA